MSGKNIFRIIRPLRFRSDVDISCACLQAHGIFYKIFLEGSFNFSVGGV